MQGAEFSQVAQPDRCEHNVIGRASDIVETAAEGVPGSVADGCSGYNTGPVASSGPKGGKRGYSVSRYAFAEDAKGVGKGKSTNAGDKRADCVHVVIRCRPMSQQEIQDGRTQVVQIDGARSCVSICKAGESVSKDFTYDAAYDQSARQEHIYKQTAADIVESVMEGYNGTIFAYGQTGTGKTFTMVGNHEDPDMKGMIPRAFEHIFTNINNNTNPTTKFLVRASFLEIYNEEIRDLLGRDPKQKLDLKEADGQVYVKDLGAFVVTSEDEMMQVMRSGERNRSTGSTLMNMESSRSHSIFTMTIETYVEADGDSGDGCVRVGKLNMVDLAGSERQSKTGSSGDQLKEATKINLSLSALGHVISALVDERTSFIPYRDSKLTRLLQDSLGGNTKTVMVANVGPADYNYDESLSTLRYAYRAKSIQNKPKINEDPKDAMIREFQEEIRRLKAALAETGGGGDRIVVNDQGDCVKQVIIEKVVEKVVSRGPTAQHVAQIEAKLEEENAKLKDSIEEQRRAIVSKKDVAEEEKNAILAQSETSITQSGNAEAKFH